jgi:hypothetical protein
MRQLHTGDPQNEEQCWEEFEETIGGAFVLSGDESRGERLVLIASPLLGRLLRHTVRSTASRNC